MLHPKIPVIVGPTGAGKSDVAAELAHRLGGEIVHADSRQVYRYMDIGTAKPDMSARAGVPHHLLDVVDPDQPFSVGDYRKLALAALSDILNRGKIPVIEGGSGLYIRAVIDGLFEGPGKNPEIRQQLKNLAQEKGLDYLYHLLEQADPQTAARLHPHDSVRIIRALEVYELTGQPISQWQTQPPPALPYQFIQFGLDLPRQELYKRLDLRAERMLEAGLLEEVKGILARGYNPDLPAMQGIGYSHMWAYLRGEYVLAETLILMQRDTRRYAKRQCTWFRKDRRIRWLDINTSESAGEIVNFSSLVST